MPGLGSGKLESLICLYLGWGRKFIIILDSDKEGKKNKNKYIKDFLLNNNLVFTLEDIDSNWKNFKIENLIIKSDKLNIGNGKNINKKQLERFFQENLSLKKKLSFSRDTINNFNNLIDFIINKLN